MTKAFISHSSKDQKLVDDLSDALERKNITTWVASKNIALSKNYSTEIIEAIANSDVVLLIYTNNSNLSKEVHKEIERADAKSKPIIPILFTEDTYHPALEYHLSTKQAINASKKNREELFEKIASSISKKEKNENSTLKKSTVLKNKKTYKLTISLTIISTGIMIHAINTNRTLPNENQNSKNQTEIIAGGETINYKEKLDGKIREKRSIIIKFDNTSKKSELYELEKGLADMLTSDLYRKTTIPLLEREKLEVILREQDINEKNRPETQKSNKEGSLLGAKYIISGSFFEIGESLRVDAKIIDVETGAIRATSVVQGKKDDITKIQRDLSAEIVKAIERDLR